MLGKKRGEGRPLPETADMKMWREEFKQMKLEDHDRVLKNLGLDDDEIAEFNEAEAKHKRLEDILGVGDGAEIEEVKEAPKPLETKSKKSKKI